MRNYQKILTQEGSRTGRVGIAIFILITTLITAWGCTRIESEAKVGQIDLLNNKLKGLKQESTRLLDQNQKTRKETQSLQKQLEETQKKYEQLTQDALLQEQSYRKLIASQMAAYEKLTTLDELNKEVDAVQKKLKTLKAEEQKLTQSIDTKTQSYQQLIATESAKYQKIQKETDQLQAKNQKLSKSIAAHESYYEGLVQKINYSNETLKTLSEQIRQQEAQLFEIERQNTPLPVGGAVKYRREINQLKRQVLTLQQEYETTKLDYLKKLLDYQGLSVSVAQKQKTLTELQKAIALNQTLQDTFRNQDGLFNSARFVYRTHLPEYQGVRVVFYAAHPGDAQAYQQELEMRFEVQFQTDYQRFAKAKLSQVKQGLFVVDLIPETSLATYREQELND